MDAQRDKRMNGRLVRTQDRVRSEVRSFQTAR